MTEERFSTNDVTCPLCGSKTSVTYIIIPPSVHKYQLNDIQYTEHWDEANEYHCKNCDAEWLMSAPLVNDILSDK